MQEHGFAVAMEVLQCKLTEAGDFGRMWASVYIHGQAWSAVVRFGTQLLFQEEKGKSLWLSLASCPSVVVQLLFPPSNHSGWECWKKPNPQRSTACHTVQ